jgi:hypothetical protein
LVVNDKEEKKPGLQMQMLLKIIVLSEMQLVHDGPLQELQVGPQVKGDVESQEVTWTFG